MIGGIGGEFLQILQNIDWNSLDAKSATLLRAALKSALIKSDEWFAELSRDFGSAPTVMPAKLPVGRPPAEATPPRPTPVNAGAKTDPPKRKRGRPPKAKPVVNKRPAATPLAIGGADAEVEAGPQPAKLFENSYVSKDGPRPGAALPADHPRRGLMVRESSVTPEVDMSDFHQVEEAMKTGKGLKDVFQ